MLPKADTDANTILSNLNLQYINGKIENNKLVLYGDDGTTIDEYEIINIKSSKYDLTKEEYIDIVIEQLERLRPEIIINRITGDPVKEDLIEPTWLLKKFCVLNDIDKEMVKRDSYQGKRLQ